MEAYPNAKVILTVRDPKKWYWSVKNTIFNVSHFNSSFPTNLFLTLVGKKKWSDFADRLSRMPTNGIDHGNYLLIFCKFLAKHLKNLPQNYI